MTPLLVWLDKADATLLRDCADCLDLLLDLADSGSIDVDLRDQAVLLQTRERVLSLEARVQRYLSRWDPPNRDSDPPPGPTKL